MKRVKMLLLAALFLSILAAAGLWLFLEFAQFGFSREISLQEQQLRQQVVADAEKWVGSDEGSENHSAILEIYNSHEPLAQNYAVTPQDNWCAAFGSCVAIECSLTDIIPTECGCERQIGLWMDLGRWEENDNYLPLPGDYIYYAWDERFSFGDCTAWADHVGIVAGTAGPFIKVIEGNRDDTVTYRILLRGNWQIRGYGLPDYAGKIS